MFSKELNTSWQAVWDEGLAFDVTKGGWEQEEGRLTARIRQIKRLGMEGRMNLRRVPVLLEELKILAKEQEADFGKLTGENDV